jgi:hypothetical protein
MYAHMNKMNKEKKNSKVPHVVHSNEPLCLHLSLFSAAFDTAEPPSIKAFFIFHPISIHPPVLLPPSSL